MAYPKHGHADDYAGILLGGQGVIYLAEVALGLKPATGRLNCDALRRHGLW